MIPLRRLLISLALGWLVLVAAPVPARASLLHLVGPVPEDLGVRGGSLAPCPGPAHCARATWSSADPAADLARLAEAAAALEGTSVVERTPTYLHATATSRLFGFVDDLEFYADAAAGQIQARSVSRLGDSDLGVNARRLETLRAALRD